MYGTYQLHYSNYSNSNENLFSRIKDFNHIRIASEQLHDKLTELCYLTVFILQGINSIESSSKLQLPAPSE